ncbi:MAG TPA: hypothetical protein VNJ02_00470 [Vicinamibacterales bacterium]|nr:hypothetical protein [Vicinamibacterales bacterium]
MTVPLDAITRISRAVAAEMGGAFEVVGVASNDGGSERVELLVTIAGCHKEPCMLILNLDRGSQDELEDDLRAKLREALVSHADSAPTQQ